MNPVDYPEAWDVEIAGIVWPGTAVVAGLKYSMAWDVKEAEGQNGATVSRKGRKLARFTIRFGMIRDLQQDIDQFDDWIGTWLPMLKSSMTATPPTGLVIRHASLQALDIDAVLVADIGQINLDASDNGIGSADVAFLEYAPAKSTSTSSASGSKSGGAGSKGAEAGAPDANDPIQQRLNTLDTLLDGP